MFKILGSIVLSGSILCVLEGATGPPASALIRQLQVTNNTRMAIVEIYISHVGTGSWQEDILGEDFLPPGNSTLVNIDDDRGSCRFDFKAVLDDGTAIIRRDVNVCKLESYTISYR